MDQALRQHGLVIDAIGAGGKGDALAPRRQFRASFECLCAIALSPGGGLAALPAMAVHRAAVRHLAAGRLPRALMSELH